MIAAEPRAELVIEVDLRGVEPPGDVCRQPGGDVERVGDINAIIGTGDADAHRRVCAVRLVDDDPRPHEIERHRIESTDRRVAVEQGVGAVEAQAGPGSRRSHRSMRLMYPPASMWRPTVTTGGASPANAATGVVAGRILSTLVRPSIGAKDPIPEEIDHRKIAVCVPVVNEMQFLLASEPFKPLKP